MKLITRRRARGPHGTLDAVRHLRRRVGVSRRWVRASAHGPRARRGRAAQARGVEHDTVCRPRQGPRARTFAPRPRGVGAERTPDRLAIPDETRARLHVACRNATKWALGLGRRLGVVRRAPRERPAAARPRLHEDAVSQPLQLTIQGTPKRSTTMPKAAAQNVLSIAMATFPPSLRAANTCLASAAVG